MNTKVLPKVHVSIKQDNSIKVKVKKTEFVKVDLITQYIYEDLDGEPYEGSYEVTPTRQEQVFFTSDKKMLSNFVVNPIPKNYGLITYNGVSITVS